MNFFVAVLIAAVTVNCLVMAINGETATDTLKVPFTDTLLPPFEDAADNSKDAVTKINVTNKATFGITATKATTKPTKKPISNDANNISPELSNEALPAPLFEPKIEQKETEKTTTVKPTTTTTTTRKPTTRATTTTAKPTTTTTSKPEKLEVPELLLDPFLPPLFDSVSQDDAKDVKVTTTNTKTPIKTTKKSFYQQQTEHTKDQDDTHTKNYQKQQQSKQPSTVGKEVKNNNKPVATTDKHVAESKTHSKQVSLASVQQNNKLQRKIDTTTVQQNVVHKNQYRQSSNGDRQHNYSFDLYLGSTTARPPKGGLPTITPFPNRLGG